MDRIATTRHSLAVFLCGVVASAVVFGLVPAGFLVRRAAAICFRIKTFTSEDIMDFSPSEPAHELLWWGPIIVLLGIGLIPAFWALLGWGRMRVRYGNEWNPAAGYLSLGVRLAVLSLLFTALIVFVIGLMVGIIGIEASQIEMAKIYTEPIILCIATAGLICIICIRSRYRKRSRVSRQ
jgi:hypothetical protein